MRYPGSSCQSASSLLRVRPSLISSPWPQDAAELPPVHSHMLRHSCGFYLANRGYDLRLIQDYLEHRDPKHTVHYTRVVGNRFEGLWR